MKLSKALALFDSLDFVTPDHIQELAVPVIAHRIVVNAATRFSGNIASDIVADILREIRVPR
jgi:MoxR-like ATPase